jgi:putative DNA primase/helicase
MNEHPDDPESILRAAGATEEYFSAALGDASDQRYETNGAEPGFLDDAPSSHGPELTEDGVALAFTQDRRDDLRYCHDTGGWFEWTGSYWRPNKKGLAFHLARELARKHNRETDIKIKAITGKAGFAAAVEKFAQRDPAFAVTAEVWDRDYFLLGTPGGVVDLRTGILRPVVREEYITKQTSAAPDATAECPLWLNFLNEVTGDDGDYVRFLQQWFGYCLTGSTQEHALLFLFGPGGNGKSVLLNTVSAILHDYARPAAMDTFTSSQSDRHPTDLAMLRGARLVMASETDEGKHWAEARIKQLTGGDPVSARFMRQDFFTYKPQFKLLFAGNHKPALKNVDDAAKRRFNMLPFLHRPANPDRDLETKLKVEYPAILRWMIDGCLDWQKHGLVRPQVVLDATAEYFQAQDIIGRWIAEQCIVDPQLQEKPVRLATACRSWATRNDEAVPSSQQIRAALEKTPGVRYATVKGTQWVKGIGLAGSSRVEEGGGLS